MSPPPSAQSEAQSLAMSKLKKAPKPPFYPPQVLDDFISEADARRIMYARVQL